MADEESERKAALIELITAAFQNVERGDGVSLHEADVLDDYGSDEECAAARLLDTEERWQEVPESKINRRYSRLSFLDAEGFRFYSPVYMLWALKHRKTRDSNVVVYAFDPMLNTDLQEHKHQKFALFTAEQNKSICGFLRFFSMYAEEIFDREHAAQVLTGYWDQFCNA